MSIGTNIKQFREERGLTQEQVADKLGITFQAVSSWERDEYKPDVEKLIKLAELFDVSVSALVEEKKRVFSTKDAIYNWEHMKTFVKTTAKEKMHLANNPRVILANGNYDGFKKQIYDELAEGFPVEMIVRGYLCGSSWRAYKSGVREICGVKLPEGMKENQKFPEPIITPTTKAELGLHDEDISKEQILERGLATPEEYALLEKYTLALFKRGTEIAEKRGLILVDTKYEFGKHKGTIYLMDEIHTPDSSRYFYKDGYQERFEKGEPQKQLSKEFVREWLMDNGFQGKAGQQVPEMTPQIVESISNRYLELFENITGEKFEKSENTDIAARIEKNVNEFLKNR